MIAKKSLLAAVALAAIRQPSQAVPSGAPFSTARKPCASRVQPERVGLDTEAIVGVSSLAVSRVVDGGRLNWEGRKTASASLRPFSRRGCLFGSVSSGFGRPQGSAACPPPFMLCDGLAARSKGSQARHAGRQVEARGYSARASQPTCMQ